MLITQWIVAAWVALLVLSLLWGLALKDLIELGADSATWRINLWMTMTACLLAASWAASVLVALRVTHGG